MGCCQTKQPLFGKEAVRPELVVRATGLAAFAVSASQHRPQSASQPTVNPSENPWSTVSEVSEPPDQRLVQLGDGVIEAVTRFSWGLRSQRFLQLVQAFLSWPVSLVLKVVAQEVEAVRANVHDLRLRWMQHQSVFCYPCLDHCQCTRRFLGSAAQNNEVIRVSHHLEPRLSHHMVERVQVDV